MLVDETGTTELNSGRKAPGDDVNAMLATCVARGSHSGHTGRRFGAFPVWLAFFKEHL